DPLRAAAPSSTGYPAPLAAGAGAGWRNGYAGPGSVATRETATVVPVHPHRSAGPRQGSLTVTSGNRNRARSIRHETPTSPGAGPTGATVRMALADESDTTPSFLTTT